MEKNHNGRWTQAEHDMFLQGLQIYGKNWKKIQQMIGTRTGCQIRSHAQKFFLKHKEKLGGQDQQQATTHKQVKAQDAPLGQDYSADDQSDNHFDRDTEISYLQIHLNRFSKQKAANGQQQNYLLNFWNNYIDLPIKSTMRKTSVDSVNLETLQHINPQITYKTHSFVPFLGGDMLLKGIQSLKGLS